MLGTVQAGFPSPAEEELVDVLSLDQFLVRRPDATQLTQIHHGNREVRYAGIVRYQRIESDSGTKGFEVAVHLRCVSYDNTAVPSHREVAVVDDRPQNRRMRHDRLDSAARLVAMVDEVGLDHYSRLGRDHCG
jgi:hypothetical protein